MTLGVVIVTYAAEDVIASCLETLVCSPQPMRVIVVDNASPDGTIAAIREWQHAGQTLEDLPFATPAESTCKARSQVELLLSPQNGGFAAGVNLGLGALLADNTVDRFWILNPDTLVPPQTPVSIANAPGGFALMGCRLLYADPPHSIQIDAGTVNRWTGVTGNLNLGAASSAPLPSPEEADFISGASMVASRAFIETAGLMPEEYFLYYEEVAWAMRRRALPLTLCLSARVYHRAGTSIGSPTLDSVASPFSVYYKHRSRMMYLQRHHPASMITGFLYGVAKAAQFAMAGHLPQASALIRALLGRDLSPDIATQSRDQTFERRA